VSDDACKNLDSCCSLLGSNIVIDGRFLVKYVYIYIFSVKLITAIFLLNFFSENGRTLSEKVKDEPLVLKGV